MTDDPARENRPIRGLELAVLRAVVVLFALYPSSAILGSDIPEVGRPTADFYGAEGVGVKVAWAVDRTTVPVDEEIVATLTITNATNPRDITRPDLKALPKFNQLFIVVDEPSPRPGPAEKEVRFKYRLRPRDLAVTELPRFDFHYYNPTASEVKGKNFPLTQSQRVELKVTPPKPRAAAPIVPLREPESLFAITRGASALDGPPFVPSAWIWAATAVAGPILAFAWFLIWRRVFPDAARLSVLRRSRAARRANDIIRRAAHSPDPPAALAGAVLGYLRNRYPLPEGAATPTEVGAALLELELPAEECNMVAAFLRACDEARFSLSDDAGGSLADTAAKLIVRLEAV
ncbi:MAG TPA: hypothetical protein VLM40_16825 [Gemmata sp.]|nr:hypothetical protein [Gemmata sp.]